MNAPHFLAKPIRMFLAVVLCFSAFENSVEAGPRVKESRLERDKEDAREPLYTEWMAPTMVGDFVSRQKGFPLYQEINRKGESRVLLVKDVVRARYYYYCRMSENNLVERHRNYTGNGLVLITLSEDADGYYSATWVDSQKVGVFEEKMEELGISMATVED